jgi:hypothetical protein
VEIFECPYPKGCVGDNGTLASELNYGSDDDDDDDDARRRRTLAASRPPRAPSALRGAGVRRPGEAGRVLGASPGEVFGDAYCAEGYLGPLCGVCDTSSVPSFYFDVDAQE